MTKPNDDAYYASECHKLPLDEEHRVAQAILERLDGGEAANHPHQQARENAIVYELAQFVEALTNGRAGSYDEWQRAAPEWDPHG